MRRLDSKGLTLLEVVVALGILGLMTAGILGLMVAGLWAVTDARYHTAAVLTAEGRLEQIRAAGLRALGEGSGCGPWEPVADPEVPEAAGLEARTCVDPSVAYNLGRVTVEVRWHLRGIGRTTRLITLIHAGQGLAEGWGGP